MNTQFHAPSFGDEVFDLADNNTTSTTNIANNPCSMSTGNMATNNLGAATTYMYQQQTTPQLTSQTKRMINLHNSSDEYHTANEDSFTTTNAVTVGGSNLQASGQQGAVGTPTTPTPTLAARKQMTNADTNEPAKPLSAYALFFRDTVSAIKQQNPTCSFPELSKIVASMWDALDPAHKSVYNKKNELARNEYIKQMRAYRLQQEQQATQNSEEEQQPAVANNTPNTTKPAVFTMNVNQQQQQGQVSGPSPQVPNANAQNTSGAPDVTSTAPSGEQIQLLSEAGAVQKCTRDGCPKRAIINPDWEDEYCSNECVVVHCRNVFNDWVKTNLEVKQQQQPELQQQQQPAQATT